MRRPFELDTNVYLQVLNKQIQVFNEEYSEQIQDEMYYIPETADIQTVSRAIDDFDYLVHSFDPKSDELLSDYLRVRDSLVGYRIALYAEMISTHSFSDEDVEEHY